MELEGKQRCHRRARRWGVSLTAACLALTVLPAVPAAAEEEPAACADLRQEIETLRREYEERISRLEARLAEVEAAGEAAAEAETEAGGGEEEAAAQSPEDAAAALRAAALAAAGAPAEAPAAAAPERPPEPALGRERNLSRLNPEISFSGDFLATTSDRNREELDLREVELAFQAALDPFSRTKWFVSFNSEGEAEVEEGYISYTGLPGGLRLAAGRVRQSFGILNRWHEHALPQSEYPLPVSTYFGDEGLSQTGLSLEWLVPRPWAGANEVTLQVTDGENEAFGGASFDRLAVLAHLKNYWDLGSAAYLEWGLSGIAGEAPAGGDSRVWGTDLTFHWQPPSRAKYREITWRSEVLLSQRDDAAGRRQEALGYYSYLEGLVARNFYAGLLYDRAEDPVVPEEARWRLFPYLTWWQSEYVRLRAGYAYLEGDALEGPERSFTLQLTWAAGPHKHEEY